MERSREGECGRRRCRRRCPAWESPNRSVGDAWHGCGGARHRCAARKETTGAAGGACGAALFGEGATSTGKLSRRGERRRQHGVGDAEHTGVALHWGRRAADAEVREGGVGVNRCVVDGGADAWTGLGGSHGEGGVGSPPRAREGRSLVARNVDGCGRERRDLAS